MTNAGVPEPPSITCYSGRIYADRPAPFVWQDKKYEVKEVEKGGRNKAKKHESPATETGPASEAGLEEAIRDTETEG